MKKYYLSFAALIAAFAASPVQATLITDLNTGVQWMVLDEEFRHNANEFATRSGTWSRRVVGGAAFEGRDYRADGVAGAATATNTWTYLNLIPGIYEVAASWEDRSGLGAASPFSINGAAPILVNQSVVASGGPILRDILGDAGGQSDVPFAILSSNIVVGLNGQLVVVLSNDTGTAVNRVVADALAIRRVADLPSSIPEPATATLGLLAFGGMMLRRRRTA